MIVVCDRCKEHPVDIRLIEYMPEWGKIEIQGIRPVQLYLCPKCYVEFKAFIYGEEKPTEVCCIDCVHVGIENGIIWCEKKDVVTGIHNSCDDAERK